MSPQTPSLKLPVTLVRASKKERINIRAGKSSTFSKLLAANGFMPLLNEESKANVTRLKGKNIVGINKGECVRLVGEPRSMLTRNTNKGEDLVELERTHLVRLS